MSDNFAVLRNWTSFPNATSSVTWLNFHHDHRDRIKTTLKTTDGALRWITNSTDSFVVDLTPPLLVYIRDGAASKDRDYQAGLQTEMVYCILEKRKCEFLMMEWFWLNFSKVYDLSWQKIVHEENNLLRCYLSCKNCYASSEARREVKKSSNGLLWLKILTICSCSRSWTGWQFPLVM